MVAQSTHVVPRDHLDRRIAALDAEVEQIQAEYGDPAEALGRYLVERFGLAALMETYQEYLDHEVGVGRENGTAAPSYRSSPGASRVRRLVSRIVL